MVALALLLAAGPAVAQTYNRRDLVRGLCRKDGCDEFSVVDKQPMTDNGQGTLYRTRVKTYHASYQGRVEQGEEKGFVFCSPVRPAIIADEEGQALAFLLAPQAAKEARENANFYALYFALCHGLEAGRAAAQDWRGVAQSLGYDVPLAQSRTVALKRAEEILDRPSREAGAR
jgi:hypothetical protein